MVLECESSNIENIEAAAFVIPVTFFASLSVGAAHKVLETGINCVSCPDGGSFSNHDVRLTREITQTPVAGNSTSSQGS